MFKCFLNFRQEIEKFMNENGKVMGEVGDEK